MPTIDTLDTQAHRHTATLLQIVTILPLHLFSTCRTLTVRACARTHLKGNKMANANEKYLQVEHKCYTDLTPIGARVKGVKGGINTVLTIVFDDEKATQDFAIRGAVIAWQQRCHNAGVVPESETVLISELAKRSGGGFKITPDSIAAKVRKMPQEEYTQTLRNLGLPESEIVKLVKKQYATK